MPYTRPYSAGFSDYPIVTTPLTAAALNTMDLGIKAANDQIQSLTTAERTTLAATAVVGQVVWDSTLRELFVWINATGGNAWQGIGNQIICTAATRPLTPFHGQRIYETDTKKELTYNGSAWVQTNSVSTTSGVTGVNNLIVPPMAFANRTSAQSIGNTTWTLVTFNAETFDTDGMFAPSDTKITIQTAGVYFVSAQIGFSLNGTADRLCKVEKNAGAANTGTPLLSSFVKSISVSDTHTTMSGIFNLAVSDTIHLSVYQNSGVALDTATNPLAFLQAIWIGRTS